MFENPHKLKIIFMYLFIYMFINEYWDSPCIIYYTELTKTKKP